MTASSSRWRKRGRCQPRADAGHVAVRPCRIESPTRVASLSAAAGKRVEHGLVVRVDLGIAADPGPHRLPTGGVGSHGSSRSVDAFSWRATCTARCRKTSSLLSKYW